MPSPDDVSSEQTARSLRAIFEATPHGMVAIGSGGAIRDWNGAFAAMCGRPDENLDGLIISDVVRPEMAAEFERLPRTLRDPSDRACFEVRCEDAGCGEQYIRLTAGRLRPGTGEEEGFYALLEDVTARRRTEEEMQALELQLRQRQKLEAIGQLAAGIAHEINTPTQYVSDNAVFLRRSFEMLVEAIRACDDLVASAETGRPDPELARQAREALDRARIDYLVPQVPRALEQSLHGLERISSIVSALKEFSHPSQGKKQPVDLPRAIETTVTVARNEWKYVAEIDMRFDPSLRTVPALRDELNQVILNLIVNAAHAIEDMGNPKGKKGTITIETEKMGSWAEIRVSDTGTGMSRQVRDRAFNPFFTTKEVGRGTGQGLAIARSVVVDKHGGEIEAKSDPGRGATFTIRLPLTDAAERLREEAA